MRPFTSVRTLLGLGAVVVALASIGLLSLSAFSQERSGGPSVPDCGTAEERVKNSGVSLEDAEKLVQACLESDPDVLVSPTPGPSGDVVTFPLKEPTTIAIEPGKNIELPTGTDIGHLSGLMELTFFDIDGSRIWFQAGTWQPFVESSTYVEASQREAMHGIVKQLIDLFPENEDPYQGLINSHLREDLPESTANASDHPWTVNR